MATTTFNNVGLSGSGNSGFNLGRILRNALNRYVEARSRTARFYVDNYLSSLTEERLAELNFTEEEIKRLKSGESIGTIR